MEVGRVFLLIGISLMSLGLLISIIELVKRPRRPVAKNKMIYFMIAFLETLGFINLILSLVSRTFELRSLAHWLLAFTIAGLCTGAIAGWVFGLGWYVYSRSPFYGVDPPLKDDTDR